MKNSLRIISGFYKGKKLITSDNEKIRPTSDRYKETLFNILEHHYTAELQGEILDLFSGTGNLGIECISRGCKRAIFVDNLESAINITAKNLTSLQHHNNYKLIKADATKITFKPHEHNFSLIFIDPPYASNLVIESLLNLLQQKIFAPRCLFICESNLNINFAFLPLKLDKKIGNKFLKIYELSL